jgi:AcrR family transcriptional regulator
VRYRTQDARSRKTREKLIEAAIKVLTTRGYANFRIAEVAKLSGVSHGGMIHHYPSKDALITAVLEHVSDRLHEKAKAKVRGVTNEQTAMKAIIESGKDFFFGTDFPIYLDLVLATRQGGRLPQAARTLARRQRKSILDLWVSALHDVGVEEQTARDAVSLVWSVLRGLGIESIGSSNRQSQKHVVDLCEAIVLNYIGPPTACSRVRDANYEFRQS